MKPLQNVSGKIKKIFSAVAWCVPFSWNASRFYTVMRIVIEAATPFCAILLAFIGKYVIDLLSGSWRTENTAAAIFFLFGGLFLVTVFRTSIRKAAQYYSSVHNEIINKRISLNLLERSVTMDLAFFDDPSFHDKYQAVQRDSHAIASIIWNVISAVSSCVSFAAAYAVLCRVSPMYGVLMLAAAIPSSIAAAKYTKSLYRLSLDQINDHRKMSYNLSVASDRRFAQEIRLYGAGGQLICRYERIWNNLFLNKRKMTRRRTLTTGLLDCLPEAVTIFIGISVAFRVMDGNATVGDYALYTGILSQLWMAISMFSSSVMHIYDNRLMIENIKSLDDYSNKVRDEGALELERIETVEFENVAFSYPSSKNNALDGLSFRLTRDVKTALVGQNGSGKTTIIKLMLRMYDPDAGRILINGRDVREYRIAALRSHFSVYFQEMPNVLFKLRDVFLFSDDAGENVENRIRSALESVGFSDVLAKTKNGFDTYVSKLFDAGGIELSGGQHQKLALARALYRSSTALVLDEPSSSLDPLAEKEIFDSLEKITDDKFTVFTSHRLSNISLADRVIVIEAGRVAESGPPDELLQANGIFAEMYRCQREKFMVRGEKDDAAG